MNYSGHHAYVQIGMCSTYDKLETIKNNVPDAVYKVSEDVLIFYRKNNKEMVTYQDLKAWGINTTILHENAISNIEINDYAIYREADILQELESVELGMNGTRLQSFAESLERLETGESIYVLTNKEKHQGARGVLHPDVLSKIAEKFGNINFYVIPSSIDEVLIINPSRQDINTTLLDQMLYGINQNLSTEQILSNHVFVYNAKEKELLVERKVINQPAREKKSDVELLNETVESLTNENKELRNLLRKHGIEPKYYSEKKVTNQGMKAPKPKIIKAPSR